MKVNLIAGVLVGLMSTGLFYALHFLGQLRTDFGTQFMWAAVAFHVAMLAAAMWRHHKVDLEIGFAKLLASGLLISLVGALVSGLGTWIFVTFVDPTFFDWIRERSMTQLAELPLGEDEKAAQLEMLQQTTPVSFVVQGISSTLMRGFLLSLPLAALMRLRLSAASQAP